ncbi:MAG: hypothetical protein AB2L11_08100 [Syntrophobacteraceae bacterium]
MQVHQEKFSIPFAVEQSISLTNSTFGYFAVLNKEETFPTMKYRSKSAHGSYGITDNPLVYPVENTGFIYLSNRSKSAHQPAG